MRRYRCPAQHVVPPIARRATLPNLTHRLTRDVGSLTNKMICDVFAALARVGQAEAELKLAVEALVSKRPYKFHAEHLISLLRDFALLQHKSPSLRTLLLGRSAELADCTPSALCAVPEALAGHPRPVVGDLSALAVAGADSEGALLVEVSRLLCKPGMYQLPKDPRVFRSKDDFWWQQIRQRNYRLRRRAAIAGKFIDPGPPTGPADDEQGVSVASSAIAHITRKECLQLVRGLERLDWR